jgi:trans-aconitate 2-methyltransferase
MPTWDASTYDRFETERARPSRDLIARVAGMKPRRILDLGCGSGLSTLELRRVFKKAEIVGVDLSPDMLKAAAKRLDDAKFVKGDAATFDSSGFDLVFANALFHWVPDHLAALARLARALPPGGALAVQMPDNFAAPSHAALFAVATSPRWHARLASLVRAHPVAPAQDYVRWLAHARGLDVWTTEYLHLLPPRDDEHPVVAWTRGAALTPFLAVLDDAAQAAFVADYRARIVAAYPPLPDGRVPFAFRRRFVVAVR